MISSIANSPEKLFNTRCPPLHTPTPPPFYVTDIVGDKFFFNVMYSV